MIQYPRMHNYPVGAVTEGSTGVQKVKTSEGWRPVSRVVAANSSKVINGGRELDDQDKVFHLDNTLIGEKGYNDPSNLVVVRQRKEKVRFLRGGRVLFIPSQKKIKDAFHAALIA